MSIYTTLPEDDPILSPQKRAAIAKKQQRAFLFSVMEKVKGFVIPVKPHQSPIPAVEQAVTVRNPRQPGVWGRCSMCQGIGLHMADCPTVGVTPR